MKRYRAILFDLLTALLDSWALWNRVAGGEAAGRAWRAAYLGLTYGCGAYQPYESLVALAARNTGLPEAKARELEEGWGELAPWPEAPQVLRELSAAHRLGVVTNCSERLGKAAAKRIGVVFEVIVTAERAGFYKPHPAPYELALKELGLPAQEVLFVAGSAFDLFGTARVGLDTWWHNRVGLAAPEGVPPALRQARSLEALFA